jgi:hypothetical protein
MDEERGIEHVESIKLPARLAWYLDAIDAARAAGVTWGQLAAIFGRPGKGGYFSQAVKRARSGRYKVSGQKPLPTPEPHLTPQTRQQPDPRGGVTQNAQSSQSQRTESPQQPTQPRRLQRIGQRTDDDEELSEVERVLAKIPKI